MVQPILEEDVFSEQGIIRIPGDTTVSEHNIRVYSYGRWHKEELCWEEIDESKPCIDSLVISGILASRILNFLHLYDGGGTGFAKYISDPDCHGTAMYSMGIIDYIKRISPRSEFESIYRDNPISFTYKPQAHPILVHLLSKKLNPKKIDMFSEKNTPHSVVLLGRLEGKLVCFEKKGSNPAGFTSIDASERHYGTTYRLYANLIQ